MIFKLYFQNENSNFLLYAQGRVMQMVDPKKRWASSFLRENVKKIRFLEPLKLLKVIQNGWPNFSFGTWHEAGAKKSNAKCWSQKKVGQALFKEKPLKKMWFLEHLKLLKGLQNLGMTFSSGTWHEACARKSHAKGRS